MPWMHDWECERDAVDHDDDDGDDAVGDDDDDAVGVPSHQSESLTMNRLFSLRQFPILGRMFVHMHLEESNPLLGVSTREAVLRPS